MDDNSKEKFDLKENFPFYVCCFITYCFIGWVYEVIWEAAIGNGFVNRMKEKDLEETDDYKVACRIMEIGNKKKEAYQKGRLRGSFLIIKMYLKDIRYRRSGFWAFLQDYVFILKYGGNKTLVADL